MFSGRYEDTLERDSSNNIFLDLSPYCFKKITDYLRARKIETPERRAPLPSIAADMQVRVAFVEPLLFTLWLLTIIIMTGRL